MTQPQAKRAAPAVLEDAELCDAGAFRTIMQRHGGVIYNSSAVLGGDGQMTGRYRKSHIPGQLAPDRPGEFAILEGPQQRGDNVTLSHKDLTLVLGQILEDFAQVVAGIVQPAHHRTDRHALTFRNIFIA